jgi:hypothetical protein
MHSRQSPHLSPKPSPRTRMDLCQMLRDLPPACVTLLRANGIALDRRLPDEQLPVDVNDHELELLLSNVAHIACLAMQGGGTLQLLARSEGARAVVHFMGVGDDACAPGLAQLFCKPDQRTAGCVRACECIVHRHGGRIYAAPSSLGSLGLTLRLPLRPSLSAAWQ